MNDFNQPNQTWQPDPNSQANQPFQLSSEDKLWGMLCHLSALAGLTCVPFLNIIVPVIIWMLKKDTMPYVDKNGREAINFQISCLIYFVVGLVICFILTFVVIGIFLGLLFFPLLFLFWIVLTIIAAIKTYDGQEFQYPLCIRLL